LDYREAMAFLDRAKVLGSVLGLETMRRLMDEMGNPHRGMKYVHIAGTNGKGSAASYISGILRCAGFRTGLYTSPYVQRFGERIQVDGVSITEEEIAAVMTEVAAASERMVKNGAQPPTVFELVTAMGFAYFQRKSCDIVVLEVGLGGRLDATNIIEEPEVAVITRIGLDHTELLGNTIAQIAAEKGGIIKPGCDVVVYDQSAEATRVIEEICARRSAKYHLADLTSATLRHMTVKGLVFDWGGYEALSTSLTGLHQLNNAVTAVKAAEVLREQGWEIGEAAVREGLFRAGCIGRLELLHENPVFLVDGAHNPQGVKALMESLRALFPGKKLRFLMGVLADKDYLSALEAALPLAERFYTVTPPIDRALPAARLAAAIRERSSLPALSFSEISKALDAMLHEAERDSVLCAFGSLYQIAAIRTYFGRE